MNHRHYEWGKKSLMCVRVRVFYSLILLLQDCIEIARQFRTFLDLTF